MTDGGAYTHADVEDAKSEAALVRSEVKVSRARGDQIGWVRHMLRGSAAARFGYRNPAEMVASRLDTRRSTARELVYLAERLADHQIEGIRSGAVSYERVLAETRLAEAGASAEAIERSRDLDLEAVKRLLQSHRKMSRQDERAVFEGQYLSMQSSLDGSHVRVNGLLGALEGGYLPPGSRPQRRKTGSRRRNPPRRWPETSAGAHHPMPGRIRPDPRSRPNNRRTDTASSQQTRTRPHGRSQPGARGAVRRRTGRSDAGRRQGRTRHRGPRPMRRHQRGHHRSRTEHSPARNHHVDAPIATPSGARPRRRLHHRRMHLHLPSRSPPHRPPIPRRNQHAREPDHALLVAPSRRRPPARHAHRPPITTPTPAATATKGKNLRPPGTRTRPPHPRHPPSTTYPH